MFVLLNISRRTTVLFGPDFTVYIGSLDSHRPAVHKLKGSVPITSAYMLPVSAAEQDRIGQYNFSESFIPI
jgi:hypothetical protein